MRSAEARFAVAAAVSLVALIPWARTVPAVPRTLTNEDVVRLVMYGTPENVLLEEIAKSRAAFDLSPDVVQELRRAGVGEGIIAAMRRRQAAMPRSAPGAAEAPEPVADPGGAVQIRFGNAAVDGQATQNTVFAVQALPRDVSRPGGLEVGRSTDLALAILCTTTDHVPDHWDTRTPIEGAPRHRLVQLRKGSRPGKVKGFEVVFLNQDPLDPIPLDAGAHKLVVGLAGRVAGADFWRLLASDTVRVEIAADQTVRVDLRAASRLRGSRMTGFKVEQTWEIGDADPAESR